MLYYKTESVEPLKNHFIISYIIDNYVFFYFKSRYEIAPVIFNVAPLFISLARKIKLCSPHISLSLIFYQLE